MASSLPNELKYTKEHEWIRIEGDQASIGVTGFALEQLGDVVYIELPAIGSSLVAHKAFGTIESTKAVSELFSPATGKVVEINKAIVDAPESLVEDAYPKGWLVRVEIAKQPDELMTADEYEKYISGAQ